MVYNQDFRLVWKLKIGSGNRNGYRRKTRIFVWNLCQIEIEKEKKTRRENWKEDREDVIATQQSITHNRGKGLGAIFNSPVAYQVFELVEEEVVITIAQINVEEVNGSTSDGIR